MPKTILTCAIIGAFTTRDHTPYAPITPEEIATQAIGAAQAGAAMVHLHVRYPDTGLNSMELAHYREVVDRIRDSGVEVLINLTTGPGGRLALNRTAAGVEIAPDTNMASTIKRTEHVAALKPDMCSLDLNTMWFGTSPTINAPEQIREMAAIIYESGVKPELEIFNSGDITLAKDLIKEGVLDDSPYFQIVLGVKYGFEMNTETLIYTRSQLPPNSTWAGFGVSRMAFPMLSQVWLLGGHCRIGMEDAIYLSKGVLAPDNAALVSKARRMIEDLGGELATVAEAREIIGLPAR
ncbi:MAG: 3-keto-5-aminohexanoate cleavage protein [Chloroflexota bacterium]